MDEIDRVLEGFFAIYDKYGSEIKSLCDCYEGVFDELKYEYNVKALGIVDAYWKETGKETEELLGQAAEQHREIILETYLKARDLINSKLENATSRHRKKIHATFLEAREQVNSNSAHYEQHLFEEWLRYGYRWHKKRENYGWRNEHDEYSRRAYSRRIRKESCEQEERRQEERKQETSNLVTAERRRYTEILGVGVDATELEIKRAYRKLAKKYHPDKNPTNTKISAKLFREVTAAYENS